MVVTIVTELIIFIKNIYLFTKLKNYSVLRQSTFSLVNYLPCHYFVINLNSHLENVIALTC